MKKNTYIVMLISLSISTLFLYVHKGFFNADVSKNSSLQDLTVTNQEKPEMKRRKFLLNKLWRDKMPEDMENRGDGAIVHVTILDDAHYKKALDEKLIEEAHEVVGAKTKNELISEIADVLEVLDCIMQLNHLTHEEIVEFKQQKFNERGSFSQRKFVTIAEYAPGSFGESYCMKEPERHIEIKD